MGVLTVGERAVTLTCAAGDNECILRTYLHLVAEQRDVTLGRGVILRRDDVLVLAEMLDLDDVRLEHKLATILRLSDPEAKALRRELLRTRVTVAAMGVGLVAGLPFAGAAAADHATPPAAVEVAPVAASTGDRFIPKSTPTTVTVEVTATTVTSTPPVAPAPADPVVAAAAPPQPETPRAEPSPGPEPEIGWSVTYERDPDFVPPEGVEIGDALVIERDLPPGRSGSAGPPEDPGPPASPGPAPAER